MDTVRCACARPLCVAATLTTGASVGGAVALGAEAHVGALSVQTLAVAAHARDGRTFVDICHTRGHRHAQQSHISAAVAL